VSSPSVLQDTWTQTVVFLGGMPAIADDKILSITDFIFLLENIKMSDRSIYWSITINNPKEDDEENIATARARGWIVEGQKEVGSEGTPHYQLAVNTKVQQRFTALKKVFPRGHIEMARNPKALKQYVHKEETRVAELPNSDRYVTSLKRLWELVTDELTSGEAEKRHRVAGDTLEPYDLAKFDSLKALDYACDALIRKGYYCIETMAVNPQTRSAWKSFWQALMTRRESDRQTDRQAEILSREGDTNNGEDDESGSVSSSTGDSEGSDEDTEGKDNEDDCSSSDEGRDASGSVSSGSSYDSGEQ